MGNIRESEEIERSLFFSLSLVFVRKKGQKTLASL
jgi:hypothetical protein